MPIPIFSGFALQDGDRSDDDDDIIHDSDTKKHASLNDTDNEGSSAEQMLFNQNELSD